LIDMLCFLIGIAERFSALDIVGYISVVQSGLRN
jgi:hypothetical protein